MDNENILLAKPFEKYMNRIVKHNYAKVRDEVYCGFLLHEM